MERTESRRRLLRLIEQGLLCVALLALGWYAAVHIFATLDQRSQHRALDALRKDTPAAAGKDSSSGTAPAGKPAPPPHRSLIGQIEIPRLDMSAIVREGVDDGTLRRAVGHIPETVLPGQAGNAAFAAHRDTFFRPLKNIRRGDRIKVTTPGGVHEYRVAETRVVSPDDVSVLAATPNPTLTLVTCYPFNFVGSAPNRFIVRAEADAPAAGAPTEVLAAGMLPVKEVLSERRSGPRTVPRRIDRSTGSGHVRRVGSSKAAATAPVRGKAAAGKPSQKKASPWRKFLRLFKSSPDDPTSPARTSRGRR